MESIRKMTGNRADIINRILITAGAALLFLPFLGQVHLFDWDEINFAECAREMIASGNYKLVQLNYQPFWEKPPLFIWMQVLSMKLFGINEFAARLPNACCGIVTLNVLYIIGKRMYNQRFGLLWTLVYAGTLLPHLYFKSGIIDPWFNLFNFLSLYFVIQYTTQEPGLPKSWKNAACAGLFIGLAVLCKGPVALLILGICSLAWMIARKTIRLIRFKHLLVFILAFGISGLSWWLVLFFTGNKQIIGEFIDYQLRLMNTEDAGHKGFPFYHFIVLLVGCFPSSVFLIPAHRPHETDSVYHKQVKLWMLLLFWVVLILFSLVRTKIVHYSSLCWFPLSFLATYYIQLLWNKEVVARKWMVFVLSGIGALLGLIFIGIPLIEYCKTLLLKGGWAQDEFAIACLNASVTWQGWEWSIGVVFLVVLLFFLSRLRKVVRMAVIGIYLCSLFTVALLIMIIVPRVEQYTQGAVIDFYKGISKESCYVETYGFKSYAYLFYTQKPPEANSQQMLQYTKQRMLRAQMEGDPYGVVSFNRFSMDWMMNEPIDKPVYIVCKITQTVAMSRYKTGFRLLYTKNGYAFYKRMPASSYGYYLSIYQ